jgi:hypothetical protein
MEEAINIINNSWKEIIAATITIGIFYYVQYKIEARKYRK